MEDWLAPYIGLPFLPHGRTREGLDCWGLVRLVLAEHFGKQLPSYADGYGSITDRQTLGALIPGHLASGWQEVPAGQECSGDLILLRVLGVPMHVGLVIGSRRFLHIEQTINSCIESYDTSPWARRVLGFWRPP
mgnify:CR=1 FL=1